MPALSFRSAQERASPEREFLMTQQDFDNIATRLRNEAGIVLHQGKIDLVYGRLARRLRALGCPDFAAYIALLDDPGSDDEHTALINALTTNLTGFFRENHHFEALAKQVLPEIRKQNPNKRLRIWSAGCSSGQEPYSIAMVLRDTMRDIGQWDALILATDIDSTMIAHGRAGIYDAEPAASIPPALARRYTEAAGGGDVEMSGQLQSLIRFRQLNLMEPWPMKGPFDIIFCRNVVIYFDKATQRVLFNRYADLLRDGGWLFIGHSETLHRVSTRFTHLGQTIYRKIS